MRLSLLALLLLPTAFPQALDKMLDQLSAVHYVKTPAISQDGHYVAWTEAQPGKESDAAKLYVSEAEAGKPKRVTNTDGAESDPVFSKDGRLAFLSDAGDKKLRQLYVADKHGLGHTNKLTDVTGFLSYPLWSPDSKRIAVLLIPDAPRVPGPTEALVPDTGVVDSAIYLQRIAIVDAASGKLNIVSPEGMYVYEFDWSPDGKQLVYTAAPGPGDDNWFIAQLYTLDLTTGKANSILQPKIQMANPRWSPDGSTIAFIGGLMSDEGVTGGDIYTIAPAGGPAKDVTPGRKSSPSAFSWLPSSQRLLFTETIAGKSAIATLDLPTGTTETLWTGEESISFEGSPQSSAIVRSSYSQPQELWTGAIGQWKQLTHLNASQKRSWGEAKSVSWKNEGFDVQGWLLLPAHYDPAKRYPMLVGIHGGPASAIHPAWLRPSFDLGLFSALDYFVFFPNPRGSYGEGESFTAANVKDFGYGDLRDILTGVDAVAAQYPIDQKRIGVAGWSYGGYMTMFTVTQTNRFRAAVAGAGISNWQSYYGQNAIDQWMIPYFGASVYDDPAVYAKSSPITFIKNVKTPTLVVVGERDGECPPPQSYEFWHALKTFGVKTEFVIYPGEGHGFHDPEHTRDLMRRTVAWFEENMK
jgi:dipeptidyl aminopeptidase/acylaminoacyl peptidase